MLLDVYIADCADMTQLRTSGVQKWPWTVVEVALVCVWSMGSCMSLGDLTEVPTSSRWSGWTQRVDNGDQPPAWTTGGSAVELECSKWQTQCSVLWYHMYNNNYCITSSLTSDLSSHPTSYYNNKHPRCHSFISPSINNVCHLNKYNRILFWLLTIRAILKQLYTNRERTIESCSWLLMCRCTLVDRFRADRTGEVGISQAVCPEAVVTVEMSTLWQVRQRRCVLTKWTLFKVDILRLVTVNIFKFERSSKPVAKGKEIEVRQNVEDEFWEAMPDDLSVHVVIAKLPHGLRPRGRQCEAKQPLLQWWITSIKKEKDKVQERETFQ